MSDSTLAQRVGLTPLHDSWNAYWFSPATGQAVTRVRVAVCCVTAVWLLSFMDGIEHWFGEQGLLNNSMAGRLVEFEETARWQHWSPLWWTENLAAYRMWLILGATLSLLGAVGLGGRLVLLGLWLVCIAWVHRITWLQGPMEPALVAMLAYLIINPGRAGLGSASVGAVSTDWLNNFTIRLVQTHWWILVAAGLLMQLGHIVWWRGEAVWWLASTGRSHILTVDMLRDNPLLVNALTHAMILIECLALWLILIPTARKLGILFGLLSAICIGILADQLLYAMLLAAGLLAWTGDSTPVADVDGIANARR